MRIFALGLLWLTGCGAQAGRVQELPTGFWDHWGDGRGELAGYRLDQPRYGEVRRGEAVLVTVTEDFLADKVVKADRPGPPAYPVLKLNEVRDFPTGVYDYNVMTSVFLPLDGRLPSAVPVKVTFSAQEWCGHVWDQVIVRDGALHRVWHSYFESEGDGTARVALPAEGVFADAGPMLARDLVEPWITPGSARAVSVWPRAIDARFAHRDPTWVAGTLEREAGTVMASVPAGTFEVRRTHLRYPGQELTWEVEVAEPHRLIAWSATGGERGELTGAVRLPYWELNRPGGEASRGQLGLPVD